MLTVSSTNGSSVNGSTSSMNGKGGLSEEARERARKASRELRKMKNDTSGGGVVSQDGILPRSQ